MLWRLYDSHVKTARSRVRLHSFYAQKPVQIHQTYFPPSSLFGARKYVWLARLCHVYLTFGVNSKHAFFSSRVYNVQHLFTTGNAYTFRKAVYNFNSILANSFSQIEASYVFTAQTTGLWKTACFGTDS